MCAPPWTDEGTKYDQTVGLAAGPWGTPDHAAGGSADGKVRGNWERTIGLFRTSDSYIVQSRSWLPDSVGGVLWWGPHAAPYTVYLPFAAGMGALPPCTLGTPAALEKDTLFWGVRYLANYAQLKRNHMIVEIDAYQARQHAQALATIKAADASDGSPASLKRLYEAHASTALAELWDLNDALMFKYADGYITTVTPSGGLSVRGEPYPDWWLKEVGYDQGGPPPVPPPAVEWV